MELHLNEMACTMGEVAAELEQLEKMKSDTKSMLARCSVSTIEAAEAHANYLVSSAVFETKYRKRYADKLADIIMCALIASANMGIDIEEALLRAGAELNERRNA